MTTTNEAREAAGLAKQRVLDTLWERLDLEPALVRIARSAGPWLWLDWVNVKAPFALLAKVAEDAYLQVQAPEGGMAMPAADRLSLLKALVEVEVALAAYEAKGGAR